MSRLTLSAFLAVSPGRSGPGCSTGYHSQHTNYTETKAVPTFRDLEEEVFDIFVSRVSVSLVEAHQGLPPLTLSTLTVQQLPPTQLTAQRQHVPSMTSTWSVTPIWQPRRPRWAESGVSRAEYWTGYPRASASAAMTWGGIQRLESARWATN